MPPITILSIAGATGQNRHFCVQIHDLLKKWVWVQVELSKMEGVNFHTAEVCQYLVFSCLIRNSAVMGIPDLESIQTGAPDDARLSILDKIPKSPPLKNDWVEELS